MPPGPQTISIPDAENLEDALRRGVITDLILMGVFETKHLDHVREALADG